MVAFIRLSRTSRIDTYDLRWQWFWELMEAYVAILMASITAFRSFFTRANARDRNIKRWVPAASWMERAKLRRGREEEGVSGKDQLPAIPRAVLTGMDTRIEMLGREGSEFGSGDGEDDVRLDDLSNEDV